MRIYYLVENEHGIRLSKDMLYNVGQPAASLAEPLVLEAPAPLYQFDPTVSPGDASVRVLPDTDIKEGDTVQLYALGNAAGGTAPIAPFPVTAFWEGRTLPFTLLRSYVIANTSMRIYYARERENAPTRYSHQVNMKVGSAPDLGAPRVLQSTVVSPTSATLNPTDVVNPPVFTIRVQYSPMYASDDISVKLIVKPGLIAPIIQPKPGDPGQGFVDFTVANSHIANHIGESLKVQYQVRRAGADHDSDLLDLRVLNFDELPGGNPLQPANLNDLPYNGTLDLNAFTGDPLLNLPPFPLISAGQKVWITFTSAGVTSLSLGVHELKATEVSTGIRNKPVRRDWFASLPDTRQFQVHCAVTFDKSTALEDAVSFPTNQHVIRQASVDDFTNFESGWNNWSNIIDGAGALRNVNNNNFWYVDAPSNSSTQYGVKKLFKNIQAGKTYEIFCDCKHDYNPYQPVIIFSLGTERKSVYIIHGSDWISTAQPFTIPQDFQTQDLEARITFHSSSRAGFSLDNIRFRKL